MFLVITFDSPYILPLRRTPFELDACIGSVSPNNLQNHDEHFSKNNSKLISTVRWILSLEYIYGIFLKTLYIEMFANFCIIKSEPFIKLLRTLWSSEICIIFHLFLEVYVMLLYIFNDYYYVITLTWNTPHPPKKEWWE